MTHPFVGAVVNSLAAVESLMILGAVIMLVVANDAMQ